MINNLTFSLEKNKTYKCQLIPALHKAMEAPHEMIIQNGHISVWKEENEKYHYLFYKNLETLTVCYKEKYEGSSCDPFSYELSQIRKHDLFIPNILIKIYLDKESGKEFEEILPLLEKIENDFKKNPNPTKEEKALYKSYFQGIALRDTYSYGYIMDSTSMKSHINNFNNHLLQQGYLDKPIGNDIVNQSGKIAATDSIIIGQVKELIPELIELRNLIKENGYTSRNKLTYNDGDNQAWIPKLENAICFSSQEIKFIAVSRDNDIDWQINQFASDDSTYKSEAAIIKAMIEGNIKDEDRVLLVQSKKPIYVGDGFECMRMDAHFSLEAIKMDIEYSQQEVKDTSIKKKKKM